MKTFLDCIPCFINQALRAGRKVSDNPETLKKILDDAGDMIKHIPMDQPPPVTGRLIYNLVSDITGCEDPFEKIKEQNISAAKKAAASYKARVRDEEDQLLFALRLAVAGNVIDLGVNRKFDLKRDIEAVLTQKFALFDYELFKAELKKAKTILYIGDNSGEAVFDKILINMLGKDVTFAYREKPVINDITSKEIPLVDFPSDLKLISTGSGAPGAVLEESSEEFLRKFNSSDMVISKGQGNYEALSEAKRGIFFLLKAKCPVIASDLDVQTEDIILKYNSN